jgi:hypothetical protein
MPISIMEDEKDAQMTEKGKFHLGQKVRIWGRNVGEVISLPK